MSRIAQIIGYVTDIFGNTWDVRERRPTRYRFDVLLGWPQGHQRGRGGRGVAVVPTEDLSNYLFNARLRDVDLPIGITTVKRLRSLLGIYWSWDDWWQLRASDLCTLTLEKFCEKHACSVGAASQRRAEIRKIYEEK